MISRFVSSNPHQAHTLTGCGLLGILSFYHNKEINLKKKREIQVCLGGSVSWASDSWCWLGSWSHGSWDQAPSQALCWQHEACLGFSFSLSLSAPLLCACSLSLSLYQNKYVNIKKRNICDSWEEVKILTVIGACFTGAFTKVGTVQRLARPLGRMICEILKTNQH